MRHELHAVDDLIFRINSIILPSSLQKKYVKAAHHLEHQADPAREVVDAINEQRGGETNRLVLRMSGDPDTAFPWVF